MSSVPARLAIEARSKMNLRHAPLLLLTVLAKTGAKTGASIFGVVRILTQAVRRALPDDQ